MKINSTSNKSKAQGWWHLPLILLLLVLFYPLFFMVCTSLKSLNEIFTTGINIIPSEPTLDNYRSIISVLPIIQYLLNSLIIALIVMTMKIGSSILASYCLVFMDVKYQDTIFYFFTITMFVPLSVVMIPNFLTLYKLGLYDTLLGVALPQLADAMGIFRIRQAMRTIPKSLVEVARLDKARHFTIMTRIVLPLVKPSIIAMSIFFFINSWNEYVWPTLILKSKMKATITTALQQFMGGEGGSGWGTSMALATVATLIPLFLYVVAQKQIIGTFMQSGVKE